jgi:hypothetical protein
MVAGPATWMSAMVGLSFFIHTARLFSDSSFRQLALCVAGRVISRPILGRGGHVLQEHVSVVRFANTGNHISFMSYMHASLPSCEIVGSALMRGQKIDVEFTTRSSSKRFGNLWDDSKKGVARKLIRQ